jgi:hypothetical protein
MLDSDVDNATRKHLLALRDAFRFAPGLSALHFARTRHQGQPPAADRCGRCGADAARGRHRVQRVCRPKPPSPPLRVIRWTCGMCHSVVDTPLSSTTKNLAMRDADTTSSLKSSILQAQMAPAPDVLSGAATPPMAAAVTPPAVIAPTAMAPVQLKNGPPRTAVAPVTSEGVAKAKPRQKQKSGLQAMLARNRERDARDAASQSAQPNLGAFLSGL